MPPPEPETEPGVIEMDATFVALKTSNLRDEPTARSERVGRLKRDSPVAVTGKVKDENWYRIEYEGRTAYVYGTLIAEVDPAALDAWGGVVDTSDADEIIDFLDEYPDSIFTDRAETKLAALTTESGGATGSETQTPVVATPSTGANAAEMAFWDSIKDSDEPADYRAYLQAYPGGVVRRACARAGGKAVVDPARCAAVAGDGSGHTPEAERTGHQRATDPRLPRSVEADPYRYRAQCAAGRAQCGRDQRAAGR